MSNQYSPTLPKGKSSEVKQNYPPALTALASTTKENASASSILLIGHDTTEIEVAAVNQGIAGKWIPQANMDASVAATSVITDAGSANFDFVVSKDTIRRLVIPVSTGNTNPQSVQGINRELGLYPAIAYKTLAGNGSVLTAEF